MKEIKFRATVKSTGAIVETKLFESWWYTLADRDETGHSRASIPKKSFHQQRDELKDIRQFIGLKDKNGKEIYEGDIVSTDGGSIIGSIKWIDIKGEDYAGFGIRDDLNKEWYWFSDHYSSKDLEVIGNIYENPELIK